MGLVLNNAVPLALGALVALAVGVAAFALWRTWGVLRTFEHLSREQFGVTFISRGPLFLLFASTSLAVIDFHHMQRGPGYGVLFGAMCAVWAAMLIRNFRKCSFRFALAGSSLQALVVFGSLRAGLLSIGALLFWFCFDVRSRMRRVAYVVAPLE